MCYFLELGIHVSRKIVSLDSGLIGFSDAKECLGILLENLWKRWGNVTQRVYVGIWDILGH